MYSECICAIQAISGVFIIIKYIYNPLLIDALVAYETFSASFCDKKLQQITKRKHLIGVVD